MRWRGQNTGQPFREGPDDRVLGAIAGLRQVRIAKASVARSEAEDDVKK